MPKTSSKTRVARHLPLSPAASLTDQELKTLIDFIDAWQGAYNSEMPSDKRFVAKLERIKGKLRDGFAGATRRGF